MEEKIEKDFIKKIKDNKKYISISDSIIKREVKEYARKYNLNFYNEEDIKNIRKQLHRFYSSYQTKAKKKIPKLLEELKKNNRDFEIINKILSASLSTKERLDKYPFIYDKIFEVSKKPNFIIDLGCGLNPFSITYMKLKDIRYNAYDINEKDLEFITDFFLIMKIDGKAEIMDVRDLDSLKKIPHSDIIFMFKLYDLIVPKNRRLKKIGEEIIKVLKQKADFIVVSFATKTLSRKLMNLPRRIGFEMMLDRNNMKYNFIQTDNEIYYVIS
jgi:hypothetical protein